jgi:hypothetical protein
MYCNGQDLNRIPSGGDLIQKMPNCLSVENILGTLSVDKSLALFNTIALGSSASDVLRSRVDLTRKQYYSRMSALLKAGLIKRRNRSYSLSSFGKIFYDAQVIIGKAIENYWKLAAIDSIELLPDIALNKIIDVLIENPQIKGSVLREVYPTVTDKTNKQTPVIIRIVSILNLASLSILELLEYDLDRREVDNALSQGVIAIDKTATSSWSPANERVTESNVPLSGDSYFFSFLSSKVRLTELGLYVLDYQ